MRSWCETRNYRPESRRLHPTSVLISEICGQDPIALLALPVRSGYLILFIRLILSKIRGRETG